MKQIEMVQAGAGAGKTTRLVKTLLDFAEDFLREKQQRPKIILTTFTRKATQELRERLIVGALDRGNSQLLDLVLSKSHVLISTIHGVLHRFVSKAVAQEGWPLELSFLNEKDLDRLEKQVARNLLTDRSYGPELMMAYDFHELYFFAKWGRENIIGEVLGRHGLEDLEEVFLEKKRSWQKTSRNLLSRLETIEGTDSFQTYRESFRRLVETLERVALENFQVEMEVLLGAFPSRPRKSKNGPDTFLVEELKGLGEELETFVEKRWFDALSFQKQVEVGELLSAFIDDFWVESLSQKKQQGKVGMVDLEPLASQLIQSCPEVVESFGKEFDYWMIDEFQDTSPRQVKILDQLIQTRPRFIVGDPQQSIYLFRGARSEVFEERVALVQEKGGHFDRQMKNYRSRPELLEFLNDFFSSLDSEAFSAMDRKSDDVNSEEPVAFFLASSPTDEKPEVGEEAEEMTPQDELMSVIHHLNYLFKEKNARFADVCILARTHRSLLDLAKVLRERGVPLHLHSGSGYVERGEVQDALAFLRFLLNPHDNMNLVTLLRNPWFRVSEEKFAAWAKESREKSYWQHWKNEWVGQGEAGEKSESTQRGQFLLEHLEMSEKLGVAESFEKGLLASKMLDDSHRFDSTGRRESNLWKLILSLRDWEREGGSLSEFWQKFNFGDKDPNSSGEMEAAASLEPSCVHLMTVHAAKGLQFPHVILIGCGQKPYHASWVRAIFHLEKKYWGFSFRMNGESKLRMSYFDQLEIEKMHERERQELNRVLYVALTRAKETVALCFSEPTNLRSWIANSNWPIQEEGKFQKEHYTYQILRGPWMDTPVVQTRKAPEEVPARWSPSPGQLGCQKGRVSVTQILQEESGKSLAKKSRLNLNRFTKAAFGVRFHRYMESLKAHFDLSTERFLEMGLGDFSEGSEDAIVQFLSELKTPPLRELIRVGQVEWGFQLRLAERIVEGQIDLWGELGGCAWIVDYKTGTIEGLEKAFSQLDWYARALRAAGVKKPLKGAALFPLEKKVVVRSLLGEPIDSFPLSL